MILGLDVSPPILLSFNLAIVVPMWNTYALAFFPKPQCTGLRKSIHRLQGGLHGFQIRLAPRPFVPKRQYLSSSQPPPQIF